MSVPKISVVIPSFNQARFIQNTLLSVINQKYPALELIVIDGGSTDGSVDIIKKYDQYISYWVSEPDGGQTNGLIKGFKRATGEILCWLNSDDLHTPNTLREVADCFRKHPNVDAIFGDSIWIDERGTPLRVQREIPFNRFIWMYTYNYIPGMSMFWRKHLYQKSGGLNPEYNLAMDADLWIRFADMGRLKHVRTVWSHMRFYRNKRIAGYGTKAMQRIGKSERAIGTAQRLLSIASNHVLPNHFALPGSLALDATRLDTNDILKILEWCDPGHGPLLAPHVRGIQELCLDHRAIVSMVRSVMQCSEKSYAIAR